MLPNIAISGYMRSGKSTLANFLVEEYGYDELSFAGPLKEEVARGVGCHPNDLNQEPLRSQIRPVLQVWGTEFRRAQDQDYWVKQLVQQLLIRSSIRPVVVADARYINELRALKEARFKCVRIDMDVEEVMDYLMEQGMSELDAQARLSHRSEQEWQLFQDYDAILQSTRGDIGGLCSQLRNQFRVWESQGSLVAP